MTLAECLMLSSHVLTLKHEAKHGYPEMAVCLFHEAAERAAFRLYIRVKVCVLVLARERTLPNIQ